MHVTSDLLLRGQAPAQWHHGQPPAAPWQPCRQGSGGSNRREAHIALFGQVIRLVGIPAGQVPACHERHELPLRERWQRLAQVGGGGVVQQGPQVGGVEVRWRGIALAHHEGLCMQPTTVSARRLSCSASPRTAEPATLLGMRQDFTPEAPHRCVSACSAEDACAGVPMLEFLLLLGLLTVTMSKKIFSCTSAGRFKSVSVTEQDRGTGSSCLAETQQVCTTAGLQNTAI